MPRRKIWFDLGQHVLGSEKKNLVSLQDGSDLYECIHCGKRIKKFLFSGFMIKGKCKVTRKFLKEKGIEEPEKEKDLLKSLLLIGKRSIVNGCWSGRIPICEKCKKKMILCPKKGHPNSKYWELQRNDGLLLYVCPSNCLEE